MPINEALLEDSGTVVRRIPFEWKGVLIALVKAQHLHAGIWRLSLQFGGPMGVNANIAGHHAPAAVVTVLGLSLVRADTVADLAVDAAVVNPAPSSIIKAIH